MANDVLKTLIAEAYGEGPEGMRRVAETILNRAAIRGLTPEQVVQQPHQYTGLHQPGTEVRKLWNDPTALAAAERAFQEALKPGDPTGGADHYYAPGTIAEPYWAKSMKATGDYGGHRFFASRPIPPGEIPNVVATQTDTQLPQRIYGAAQSPTSAASSMFPTTAIQPRMAPGNDDVYAYRIPDQTNTDLVGGIGSLTPSIGQRPDVPLPRPRPDMPVVPYNQGTTIATVPTPQPRSLPPLPPPRPPAPPQTYAGQDGYRPAPYNAGVTVATIPTTPRPATPGPADGIGSMPSLADMQGLLMPPSITAASLPSIPGPNAPPKDQSRLAPSLPGLPLNVPPQLQVASLIDIVPPTAIGDVPLPRPRPMNVTMPTPAYMRPPNAQVAMPTPATARPMTQPALRVAVNGANSYSGQSSGGGGSPSTTPRYEHQGREVTPQQTLRYDPDSNTFKTVTVYR